MKILLIADADSIFITNYVIALKQVMKVEVYVYSPFPSYGNYEEYPYDHVYFENDIKFKSYLLNRISFLLTPFIQRRRLSLFLKQYHKEYFDIIHLHRILPAWVINIRKFKKFTKRLYLTFWGGELDVEHILLSKKLYFTKLKRLVGISDVVVNSLQDNRYIQNFPCLKEKGMYGIFGSSIIDRMNNDDLSRDNAKELMDIPVDTITVMVGYSGKQMHNHLSILTEIVGHQSYYKYKDKLYFVVPMTRGGSLKYSEEIKSILINADARYSIYRGEYFTDTEVANLRKATEFVFQLSSFDGVSSSIKECLCAGSVVIIGDWLKYSILKRIGFRYPEVKDIHDGVNLFYKLLDDYPSSVNEYDSNILLGHNKFSWAECIKDWVRAYNRFA